MTPDAAPGLPRRLAVLIGVVEAALLVFLLTQSGGGAGLLFVVFVGVTAAVGWLLSLRVPGNPIGWLLLVIAGLLLLGPPTQAWGEAVLDTRPNLAAWLLWYGGDRAEQWAWLPPIGLTFTQLLLLFPDGRLPSPRWRTFSYFTIGAVVLGTAVLAMFEVEVAPGLPSPTGLISPDSALTLPVTLLLLAAFAGSAASLVVRFRRADALQRAQIKWVALAGGVVVGDLHGGPDGLPDPAHRMGRVRDLPRPGVLQPDPVEHRGGGAQVPAVRDRPDHQPDGVLRDRDGCRPGRLRGGRDVGVAAGCRGPAPWRWRPRRWLPQRCSARCFAGSRTSWTAGSTGRASTACTRSTPSRHGCGTRWTPMRQPRTCGRPSSGRSRPGSIGVWAAQPGGRPMSRAQVVVVVDAGVDPPRGTRLRTRDGADVCRR